LPEVGTDLVLLAVAADRVDAGDSRHADELRADDPLLDRAQVGLALDVRPQALALGREVAAVRLPPGLAVLHGRPATLRMVEPDRPHVDLPEPRRDRAERRLRARRQARAHAADA